MELTPEICQRLKSVMEIKNETGYTIHKKLGISATTIGNYLNGKITNADNTKIKAICNFLEIDIVWLKTGDTNPTFRFKEKKEEYVKGNTEDLLNQLLLAINAKDEQFTHIRKDTHTILELINSMKKEISQLKKEIDTLKKENQKFKQNNRKDT